MRYWKTKSNIPSSAKVGVSLVTYNQGNSLASLIYALKSQTYQNFKVYISHDGPWLDKASLDSCKLAIGQDARFDLSCTSSRAGKHGHNMRQPGLDKAMSEGCNWLCTMNADCWYVPVYFEWLLSKAYSDKASFVYCNMVHSHKLWAPVKTTLMRGRIDGGAWLASSCLCSKVKWTSTDFAADWFFVNNLSALAEFKPAKVDGYLFTHN
jgi:Glycosyl transferase family 2